MPFKDHWPHDLPDLAEKHLTFYNDYNFLDAKGNRLPAVLMKLSVLNTIRPCCIWTLVDMG